jgi:hypothetical protein
MGRRFAREEASIVLTLPSIMRELPAALDPPAQCSLKLICVEMPSL